MKRGVELERRLRTLTSLREAVGALKSLSAHHFRGARRAVEPAASYRQGIERIVHGTGAALGAGDGAAGLLVIGGELGLCGGYNAQVVATGAARREELGEGPTFCVGRRASVLLGRMGVDIRTRYSAPTSVDGITGLLMRLAEDVMETYAAERLSSFEIVSSRFAGVGVTAPESVCLMPVSDGEGAEPGPKPRYVRPDHLASVAIREYLYITLYDLLLDAIAAEHGARLIATQSAERWLDERTERLRRHLASARREASTQEMIEIAAGARVRGRA